MPAKNLKTTNSTIIRAAWALVTASLTGSNDVLFGETLMGRNVPLNGVEQIEGPMITTIPIRVQTDRSLTSRELLQKLSKEAILRFDHEHMGLQHIRRISSDAQVACDLRTGLVIQPGQVGNPAGEGGLAPVGVVEAARAALRFNSYALMLVCSLEPDNFLVMASFDSTVVSVTQMENALELLDATVQHISQNPDLNIDKILPLHGHIKSQPHLIKTSQSEIIKIKKRNTAIRAQTTMECALQKIWSTTLNNSPSDINADDHFFRLGGDSISAMKLVSTARLQGYTLNVSDIFKQPVLRDLARFLETVNITPKKETIMHKLFSSLDLVNMFLTEAILPALASPAWKVQDILPATTLQEGAVKATIASPRFSVQYNLLHLDMPVAITSLMRNWENLISLHEILRTVYVQYAGQCLQVILEDLNLPLMVFETNDEVESFSKSLCAGDANTNMPLGSSFLKFMLVNNKDSKERCLIVRMSHAQYDGLSLPALLLQLQALYDGKEIAKGPQYSTYVHHTLQKNNPETHTHWRTLLNGSSMLYLRPRDQLFSKVATAVSKKVGISGRPLEATTASLLKAAWSIVLARFHSVRDVTFGQVVAGRSINTPDCEKIQGPCDNHNPVRIKFQPGWTYMDLLHHIQNQHINNSLFENTQLRDIIKHSTNWPSDTEFDSVVHHQDIDYFDTMRLGNSTCRLDAINPHAEPAQEWKVQSFSRDGLLNIEIVSSKSWKGLASTLLDDLCVIIIDIIQGPTQRVDLDVKLKYTRA
jgi:aryl carrier-like protein